MTIITRLDIGDAPTVRDFRREIRQTQEIFLRFTHRYWFSEVSDQPMARDLFRMWSDHLSLKRLHADLREEIQDMLNYLKFRHAAAAVDHDCATHRRHHDEHSARHGDDRRAWNERIRQSGGADWLDKLGLVALALAGTTLITYVVLRRSQPVARFLEAVADTRSTLGRQWKAFMAIFWDR